MTNTPQVVRNIFYSGSFDALGDEAPVVEIVFLLDNEYLKVDTIQIAEPVQYADLIEEISKNPHAYDLAAGGSNTHIALKILAADYLQDKYGVSSRFEQPLCGYSADVLSVDKQFVAECGHTQNPQKMLDYFRQTVIQVCLQIPYPDVAQPVLGYTFTASKEMRPFLEAVDEQKHAAMKNIIMKRRPF